MEAHACSVVYTNENVSIFNKPQFIIYSIELYTSFLIYCIE